MESKTAFRELQKLIEGEVLFDDLSRAIYSSAASLYRVKPLGIVKPRHKKDVITVVNYARRQGIPLTPRGGGTSRTGNEVGEGILLDFSKYMNQLLEINPEGKWVRLQPGIILAFLNKSLKPHQLFFPIDPSTKDHCTLGGMIANNSSGPHAVRYGATRDYVLSLEVVLSNGETITTGSASSEGVARGGTGRSGPLEEDIYKGMPGLLKRYRRAIEEEKPFTRKNSAGYDLWRLQDKGGLDLTSLFVGSEGTLGIITEARLRLMDLPGKASGGLIYFDNLDHVAPATQEILELSPAMLEIIERQILDLARRQKAELRPYLPEGTEALLFVEFQDGDAEQHYRKFKEIEERIIRRERLAVDLKVAKSAQDMAMLEKVRSVSGPILNKVRGPRKPVAFIEDAAVYPDRLSEYIQGLRELFKRFEVEASIYGHAGDGNLHLMVFLDLTREDEVRKMVSLAEACHELVLGLKGTISGEHGDGRLRTYYLRRQYPNLYPAMVEIKKLFDPENILNPGSIVGTGGNPLGQHLKFAEKSRTSLGGLLGQDSVKMAIETCSGCGKCRSYCPISQQIQEEWAIGRAKTTLLRELLSGALEEETIDSPEFERVMDSCVNCKRCLTECPSGVDIPWVALSSRAHAVEKHGEPFSQRFLADTRFLCETGSVLAPLANRANSIAPARRCLEIVFGIDRRRHLPLFHRRTVRERLKDRPSFPGKKQAVYFLGCYSNFNEPEEDGLAAIEVLERNGFQVLVPDFRCCGIASINSGAIRRVTEDIETNVKQMAFFVDQGLSIVFSEPSCALAVRMEYPKILKNSKEALRVAERCFDIHQFLMMLHQRGELDLNMGKTDLAVGYHNPCHLRALGVVNEPAELLRLIPGVRVQALSDGCCGLVGTFGMKRKNFDLSMAVGERLFKEIADSKVDEVSTPCGACRLQILQGTRREAVPPVSLLAEAYRRSPKSTR